METDNGQLTPIERELIGVLQTAGLDGAKLETLENLTSELKSARKALHDFAMRDTAGDTAVGQLLAEQVRILDESVQQMESEFNSALERAQADVERYFNFAMERVSGWYKRRVQFFILILAALVTIIFNVDTIAIIENLMNAPIARAALVDQATTTVQNGEEGTSTTDQTSGFAQLDELQGLGLEIGWNECTLPGFAIPAGSTVECVLSIQERSTFGWWISKFGGLAITIAAASLGAPFWFDVLNKIVNLRLSGQRPKSEHSVIA
jgi:hypothetical protein